MQRSYYQQLPLQTLGPEAIRALLRDQPVGEDPRVASLPETIQARTKRNPISFPAIVAAIGLSTRDPRTGRQSSRIANPTAHAGAELCHMSTTHFQVPSAWRRKLSWVTPFTLWPPLVMT
jgi:hypothetical protein